MNCFCFIAVDTMLIIARKVIGEENEKLSVLS